MAYSKPYLSVPDQLALIKGRGMIISDDALAEVYLNRIGYYRLSGYWYPYRESQGSGASLVVGDKFRPNTKFSEIVELYVFDKKLRLLLMDVIERIEIALRVQITLELGKLGAQAHRDAQALHLNFQRASTATGYAWIVWEKQAAEAPRLMWVPPCRKKLERPGDYQS
ncbi:Abi family protein [Bradyrhizobium sp. WSM1417]|uniref:Abi family protein n=1 Tax=Bradyrhizobium sp. WSM1417 TaxID=754500 RepID=UPI0006840170|nr:Abi family protein [Bradyrhizobium sp. WSM1417]